MELAKNLFAIRRVESFVVELTIFFIPILFVIPSFEDIFHIVVLEGFILFYILHSLGYMLNCWADRDLDKTYKTWLSKAVAGVGVNQLRTILVGEVVLSLAIGVHLSWVTGRWVIFLLVLLGLFLGIQYSMGPLHFKSRGVGQLICLWLLMYAIPMMLSAHLVNAQITWGLLFLVASYATVEVGILLVSTSEDLPEDREKKLTTTTISLGLEPTLALAFMMVLIGGLVFLGTWMMEIPESTPYGWTILAQTLLAVIVVFILTEIYELIRQVKIRSSEEGAIETVRDYGRFVPLWTSLVGVGGLLCGVAHLT